VLRLWSSLVRPPRPGYWFISASMGDDKLEGSSSLEMFENLASARWWSIQDALVETLLDMSELITALDETLLGNR
jgi:hypothetical protein